MPEPTAAGSAAAPDRSTVAAFLGVVVFGGANAVAVRQTVLELAPFWGASMRFAIAGLVMAAIAIGLRRGLPRGASLWGAALYGLVGFAASYGLLYLALVDAPASSAVLIALTPLATFGLAIAHRQERFRLQGLLGALIAVAGVAIVFADQLDAAVPLASLVLILLGTISIAESAVIVKWIPRSDPFGTNAVAMLVGSVILFAIAVVAGDPLVVPQQPVTWLAVGYLVVIGSVVMFALYLFALQRWTASAMSYVTLLFPIVTVILAVVLLGEPLSPALVLGGVVVVAGTYLGAFWHPRPRRSTATSLPECLPIEDCPQEPSTAGA